MCVFWYFLVLQVTPLRLGEELPIKFNSEKTFYVKQSWDGKCFKPLSPDTFSKLKEANKKGGIIPNSSNSFISSDMTSPLKQETDRVVRSATKPKNVELEIESKHSASKSSLAKERHSQRMANGIKTPTARKKLQLNSMYIAIFCPLHSFEHNMFCASSFWVVQLMVILNIRIFSYFIQALGLTQAFCMHQSFLLCLLFQADVLLISNRCCKYFICNW